MFNLIPLMSATLTPIVNERAVYDDSSSIRWFYTGQYSQQSSLISNSSKEPISIKPSEAIISSILNRLRTFKNWPENWNAEGAKRPVLSAIDDATLFLSLWSSKYVPEVGLTHDGLPMFSLKTPNALGEIIVNADSSLDYYFEYEDGRSPEGDENIPFNKVSLPEQILASAA
jgi:hypothetical protein